MEPVNAVRPYKNACLLCSPLVFLEARADAEKLTTNGFTPLFIAAMMGSWESMQNQAEFPSSPGTSLPRTGSQGC